MLCRWFLCATFCRSLCSQYPFGLDIFCRRHTHKKTKENENTKGKVNREEPPSCCDKKSQLRCQPARRDREKQKTAEEKKGRTKGRSIKNMRILCGHYDPEQEKEERRCARKMGARISVFFFLRKGKKRREREKSTTGESTDAHPRMCATCANNSGRAPDPGGKGAGGPTGGRARSGRQCWSKYRR